MEKTGNKRIDDILIKAREQLEGFGDLHDEGCPCTLEGGPYPDKCDCSTMDGLEKEVRIALEELDKYWLFNLNEHRRYCSAAGNKILTKIKRNIFISLEPIKEVSEGKYYSMEDLKAVNEASYAQGFTAGRAENLKGSKNRLMYQTGLKEGFAEGVEKCIEAVEKLRPPKNLYPLVNKQEVLNEFLKSLGALKNKEK